MPRLLLFAPFQRVLVDRNDNTISFIQLLEGFEAPLADLPAQQLAEGVTIPMAWGSCAVWLQQPEDEGRRYEQRVSVVRPDGVVALEAQVEFAMTLRTQRNTARIDGFPASPAGEFWLKLELRGVEPATEWELAAEYPVSMAHKSAQDNPAAD